MQKPERLSQGPSLYALGEKKETRKKALRGPLAALSVGLESQMQEGFPTLSLETSGPSLKPAEETFKEKRRVLPLGKHPL